MDIFFTGQVVYFIYMMGYGGGWGMGASYGLITWLVITIDLILLGVWLWKQIKKN